MILMGTWWATNYFVRVLQTFSLYSVTGLAIGLFTSRWLFTRRCLRLCLTSLFVSHTIYH